MSVVALAGADAGPSDVALVAAVGRGHRIVSARAAVESGLRVDAIVASSPSALGPLVGRWPGCRTACRVRDLAEVETAADLQVDVPFGPVPSLFDLGVLPVPPLGLDLDRHPVVPPLTRARLRVAAGLPERLVLAVGGAATPDRTTSLGVASAAVVGVDLVAIGAALGTPMVVLADAAAHLGGRDGIEVLVASDDREADRLAGRLAADVDLAVALSRRVRSFAEHHLDLAVPARALRRRLGLAPTPSLVLRRLEELGTPPGSRIRARVRHALAPFPLAPEVSP